MISDTKPEDWESLGNIDKEEFIIDTSMTPVEVVDRKNRFPGEISKI